MGLFSYFKENMQFPEIPPKDLGSVDEFNGSSIMVVYTPISNITQLIMNKTTLAPSMKGKYANDKKELVLLIYFLIRYVHVSLKFQ